MPGKALDVLGAGNSAKLSSRAVLFCGLWDLQLAPSLSAIDVAMHLLPPMRCIADCQGGLPTTRFLWMSRVSALERIFADVIRDQIARCDALVALIGRSWLRATDRQGRRRLDLIDDLVRIEIASALRLGKRVIPVLVGAGAVMPTEELLPDDLKPLVRRNALRLTHERFVDECSTLVREIEHAMIGAQGDRYARRMTGEMP